MKHKLKETLFGLLSSDMVDKERHVRYEIGHYHESIGGNLNLYLYPDEVSLNVKDDSNIIYNDLKLFKFEFDLDDLKYIGGDHLTFISNKVKLISEFDIEDYLDGLWKTKITPELTKLLIKYDNGFLDKYEGLIDLGEEELHLLCCYNKNILNHVSFRKLSEKNIDALCVFNSDVLRYLDYSKLTARQLNYLILYQEDFPKYISLNKLSGEHMDLLCGSNKSILKYVNIGKLSNNQINTLCCENEDILDYVEFDFFDDYQKKLLLTYNPKLLDSININFLTNSQKAIYYTANPGILNYTQKLKLSGNILNRFFLNYNNHSKLIELKNELPEFTELQLDSLCKFYDFKNYVSEFDNLTEYHLVRCGHKTTNINWSNMTDQQRNDCMRNTVRVYK